MTGPFIADVREEERVTSLRTSALEVPVSGFSVSGFRVLRKYAWEYLPTRVRSAKEDHLEVISMQTLRKIMGFHVYITTSLSF